MTDSELEVYRMKEHRTKTRCLWSIVLSVTVLIFAFILLRYGSQEIQPLLLILLIITLSIGITGVSIFVSLSVFANKKANDVLQKSSNEK